MKIFFKIFFLILLANDLSSNEVKLICETNQDTIDKNFENYFSKVINFENKTLSNLTGNFFDKVLIFNNYEIVLQNIVFHNTSTYNISERIWTIYKDGHIKKYKCKKEKRR